VACQPKLAATGPPSPKASEGSLLSLRERRLVGEEVVELPCETNSLEESAGESGALKANGFFEWSPHLADVRMHPPPDLNGKGAPSPDGSAPQKSEQLAGPLNQNHSDAAPAYQARSQLELQIFCLTRRFALAAPTAASLVPLIYGSWRS
jgi:hypothetical protein